MTQRDGFNVGHSRGVGLGRLFSREEVVAAICSIHNLDNIVGAPRELMELAALIRTDLDYFSDEEINLLMHIGYTCFDGNVNRYLGDLTNQLSLIVR